MKSRKTVVAILFLGLLLMACVPAGEPDLVVPTIQVTGQATINADGGVDLPIRVIVRNAGDAAAGRFKVSAEYTDADGTFAVAFSTPGGDLWYPVVPSLAAGASVVIQGKLIFTPWASGETVRIRAIADSCSGDEFMPTYCRVDESNENNNTSGTIVVALP